MKKTTIEIPDPLFLKAEIRAARDGLSMRDLFLRALFFLIFVILITACAAPTSVPPTATLTPMTPIATLEPSPTATPPAPTEGAGSVELQPQTVGCLHPEDVETWCAGLEPKDPHGLWQMAIDALVDGPANAEYWANTLGKTAPTHEEKLAWLTTNDYFLPAVSPNGTDFLVLSSANGGKYGEFRVNKPLKMAGGASIIDIPYVVLSPDTFQSNAGGIKDWYLKMINSHRGSNLIGSNNIYSPGEALGIVFDGEKFVFVGGSGRIPDNADPGKIKLTIGGNGVEPTNIFSSLYRGYWFAVTTYTADDLNLKNSSGIHPEMGIVTPISRDVMENPAMMSEEDAIFRKAE
jgi:hypothetical protein